MFTIKRRRGEIVIKWVYFKVVKGINGRFSPLPDITDNIEDDFSRAVPLVNVSDE